MSPVRGHSNWLILCVPFSLWNRAVVGFSLMSLPEIHFVHSAASMHVGTASSFLGLYQDLLTQHALPTKMLTGASLAVMGDALAQKQQHNQQQSRGASPTTTFLPSDDTGDRSTRTSTLSSPNPNNNNDFQYNVHRASSFAVFDACYRALQHAAFPILTTHLQGQFLGGLAALMAAPFLVSETATVAASGVGHAAAALEQTLASQLIIVPFLYYPAFFVLTGTMQGLDAERCWKRAQDNFLPLMQRNLIFWIPVQFVQFSWIPTDYQIGFLSCAGLAWTVILSVTAGSAQKYATKASDSSSSSSSSSASTAITSTKLTAESAILTLSASSPATTIPAVQVAATPPSIVVIKMMYPGGDPNQPSSELDPTPAPVSVAVASDDRSDRSGLNQRKQQQLATAVES